VNYFEHHIGDYDKNTSHLSACEDGIYCRMIRRYLDKEVPLDPDTDEIKRVVRARTREEKKSVDAVLKEFFYLEADGWHHKTCDEIIAAYQAGEPEREAKKANEETRLKRHRDERAGLFAQLTAAGRHATWNIGIKELRLMVASLHEPETPQPATPPVTAPATPATATHTPIPNTHTPDTIGIPSLSANDADPQIVDGDGIAPEKKQKYTEEDQRCAEWIFDRILKTNPKHSRPKFTKWADEVRLLREGKKITHREICEMFDWVQTDTFWRANILSPAKLRDKWDQLTIKRGTPQKGQKHDNFAAQDYRAGVRADGSF
jgi:uncharacterized protein YdaU (DUF1376 family)